MKARKLIAMLLVVATLMSFAPMTAFAADGTAENKIVTVQYLFKDGEIAADPWTASIAAGESLNQTINYPAVVGYQVSESDSTVGAGATVTWGDAALTLDIADITSNITITVVYVPALVNYTVKFFQQNVDNDNYTLAETVTMTGLTGSKVNITANKYDGFYELPYDADTTIAADSSTEVEVYYDRYYYLLSFDLGGGYGVDPQFLRYGQAVEEVGTPVRPGYSFLGWKDEDGNTVSALPTTMPADNVKYYAQWEAETVSYTVAYWYENADDTNYSYVGKSTHTALAGSTVSSGDHSATAFTNRDDEHFTYNSAKAETVTIAGDGSTVLDVYFTRNTYTIYFEAEGLCVLKTHNDSCYTLTCTQEVHEHSACGSTLTCTITEHTHSSDCCTTEEHDHESAGCTWFFAWLCGKSEHTHGEGDCPCTQQAHTHSEGCYLYDCGKTAHAHTAVTGSCYTLSCEEHSHTHDSSCTSSSSTNVVKVVTRKYDADITDIWPIVDDNGVQYTNYNMWQSSVTSKYYTFLEKMPGQDITMTDSGDSGTKYTWYYYLEVLPGQDTTGLTIRTDSNKTYYEYRTSYAVGSSLSLTYEEDYFPITGFSQRDSSVPSFSNRTAYLYYTRNQHTLTFNNRGTVVKTEANVYYDAALSAYGMVDGKVYEPAYPSNLEENAYEFEGWYTTSDCIDGTKVDFTTATMPDGDLELYANWVPVEHTVEVFLTEDSTESIKIQTDVAHRTFAEAPATPTNGQYTFVGWFYRDANGNEKAFDFASMPITQDMVIYAKWSSKTLVPYIINYTLEDGTVIADPTTGNILGGNTKTFDAKGGEDLYTAYQVGYFPKTPSHSLTAYLEGADANNNGVLDANEFTFVYVQKDAVPYTVKYLDATTLEPVADEKYVEDNRHAVVTETAENVNGYLPDAFQKRLIVTDGGENVLIFYYTEDATHALVTEQHILVNGSIETEYSSGQLTGVIGESYAETNYVDGKIDGYVFDHATVSYYDENGELVTKDYTSGTELTLTAGGLHFKFYYRYNRFDVYYQGVDQTVTYDLVDSFNAVAVSNTHAGVLYAGMYTDKSFTTPLETVGANNGDGMAFQPVAGATYYVKEINERYALPGLYLIWDTRAENNYAMSKLFLMTAIDNNQYLEVGIELDYADDEKDTEIAVTSDESELETDDTNPGEGESNNYDALHEKFVAQFSEKNFSGVRTDTVTAASGFFGSASDDEKEKAGAADAYLYIYDFTAFVTNPEQVRFSGFFVTPDGIRVEGVKYRDLYKDSTKDNVETLTKNNFVRAASDVAISCTDKYPAATASVMSFAPLMMRSAFTITGDIVDTYTITKIDGDTTETQEVEPGDSTGTITYTEKDGDVFAGWYTDEACTVAADFSDVQDDMTVYAKYIDAKKVITTQTYAGKYMSATVTAPGGAPAIGLNYTVNGETTEVTLKKYNGILSVIAKLLGSKSETYTASWNMNQLTNGDTFTVTAYWVTEDGTVVEIETESYICSRNRISVQ